MSGSMFMLILKSMIIGLKGLTLKLTWLTTI